MQRAATLVPHPVVSAAASRWCARLRHAWDEFVLDDDQRFLRGAGDPVELERRLRRLERGRPRRFAPLDPEA